MIVPTPSQLGQMGLDLRAFVELLKNLFEIVAIAVGATWTYFNYFKGRTYKARLECSVEGSIDPDSERSLLRVVVKVRNVGLSKMLVDQKGTILQLYPAVASSASPSWPCQMVWNETPAVFDVFKNHAWVEPSEPVEDYVLIELPDLKAPAYKLTLKVLSKNIFWTAKNIVQVTEGRRIIGGAHDQGMGSDASGSQRDSGDSKTARRTAT